MIRATLYHKISGHVLHSVAGHSSDDICAQLSDGIGSVEGRVNGDTHWISDGEASEREPLSLKPSAAIVELGKAITFEALPHDAWLLIDGELVRAGQGFAISRDQSCVVQVEFAGRYVDCQFELRWERLEALAREKCEKVNQKRAALNADGFVWNGHRFDCDDVAQQRITSTCGMLAAGIALPSGFTWRTYDNESLALSPDELLALGGAMFAHASAIFAHSVSLKDAITAASDVAGIDAINIDSGWPV